MLTTGRGVLPAPDSVSPDLQPWGRKNIQKSILVDFKLSTKLSHLQSQWIYSRMVPTKIYCFSVKKKKNVASTADHVFPSPSKGKSKISYFLPKSM